MLVTCVLLLKKTSVGEDVSYWVVRVACCSFLYVVADFKVCLLGMVMRYTTEADLTCDNCRTYCRCVVNAIGTHLVAVGMLAERGQEQRKRRDIDATRSGGRVF